MLCLNFLYDILLSVENIRNLEIRSKNEFYTTKKIPASFTVCMVTTLVKIVMSSSESSSLDEPSVSSTSLPSLSKSRRVLLLLGVRGAEKENKTEV